MRQLFAVIKGQTRTVEKRAGFFPEGHFISGSQWEVDVFFGLSTMAPREATGTFPDQYLTFDYETSAAIGIPPPVHDPTPNQAQQQQQQQQATPRPHQTDTGTGGSLEGGDVAPSTDSTRSSPQTNSEIDPLSIDPTSHQSPPWQSSINQHGAALPSFPSDIVHGRGAQVSPISVPSNTQVLAQVPFSSEVTCVEPNRAELPRQVSQGDIDTNSNVASPISFAASNASSSPVAGSSPVMFGSPIPIVSSHVGHRVRIRPTYQRNLRSVLDNTTSIESDDEDDEDVPGLDRTFDSAGSALHSDDAFPSQAHHIVADEDGGNDESSTPPFHKSMSHSSDSSDSLGIIHRNSAFDMANDGPPSSPTPMAADDELTSPLSPNSIHLSFSTDTTVEDLKYFAERGCIVALLQALTTPRLVTLGTRMLADYAKMSERRVAVASNRRILEFVQRTMLQASEMPDWLGREYAVETVRSLTATEESDRFLMSTPGLLNTLAIVARGGPYLTHIEENGVRTTVPLASEKARLHACIAIMNLSCGKANKIEIAKVSDVLEAMRDVMVQRSEEARLKATTCIKNLSNADANDASLLGTPGLVEALGHVAATTCTPETGATTCTTNACLALMNLSISKANKHRVFRTPGVMDALMTVLERTTAQGSSNEARIKACSALSNLAIGYDNKIPMFAYPGFVDAILNVIQTDTGEARTKACSILWSFAAEMKNQVPVSVARVSSKPFCG